MKRADVIRVWYCKKCGQYEIDFTADTVFCSCGKKMVQRRYRQIRKEVKN